MRLGLRPQERPPRSGYDFDKNYFYMCILENLDMFLVFFRTIELERIYLFCYKGFYIPSIDSKEKLANFSDYRYFFLQEIIDILYYITFRNERLIFRVVYITIY